MVRIVTLATPTPSSDEDRIRRVSDSHWLEQALTVQTIIVNRKDKNKEDENEISN